VRATRDTVPHIRTHTHTHGRRADLLAQPETVGHRGVAVFVRIAEGRAPHPGTQEQSRGAQTRHCSPVHQAQLPRQLARVHPLNVRMIPFPVGTTRKKGREASATCRNVQTVRGLAPSRAEDGRRHGERLERRAAAPQGRVLRLLGVLKDRGIQHTQVRHLHACILYASVCVCMSACLYVALGGIRTRRSRRRVSSLAMGGSMVATSVSRNCRSRTSSSPSRSLPHCRTRQSIKVGPPTGSPLNQAPDAACNSCSHA
jgi:hypothetical protein